MGKIVAIGGGVLREGQTDCIDNFILELSGNDHPKVLFIPTANYDSPVYSKTFIGVFESLGCEVDVLNLLNTHPSDGELETRILSPDVIYVGGGNTLKMMRRWRLLGVDKIILRAWEQNTVLCGVSAGAICWFDWGHSDSMSFYSETDWDYVRVKGMGLIKGLACPHYDSDTKGVPRKNDFHNMVRKYNVPAIAIDNRCAFAVSGDRYRIITATDFAGAYKLSKHEDKIVEEPIQKSLDWNPITNLY